MIKSTKVKVQNAEVLVEYEVKNTTPPNVAYRFTYGNTILLHSMTVHADQPKEQSEVIDDHDAIVKRFSEEAYQHEVHRNHIKSL